MSLLLAFGATTSSAQILNRSEWRVTTSGECDDSGTGHAASIIDGNNDTYWHSNYGGNHASGDATKTFPQFFQVDLGSKQEFNRIGYVRRNRTADGKLENGTVKSYKIYVSDNPFDQVSNEKSAAAIVNALGKAQLEGNLDYTDDTAGETATKLKTIVSSDMLSGRYVLFVVTNATSQTTDKFASCAEFYLSKNTDFTMRDITYHLKVGDVEYGSKTFKGVVNEDEITTPTMNFLENGNVTKTADGYNIACTEKPLPFVAQKSFDATSAQWYAITLRGNQNNYLLSAKGGESVGTTTISLTNHPDFLEDVYQWAFVGNLKDGFKLYSKSQNKPVTLSGQLKLVDGDGTTFKLKELTSGNGFGMFETEAAGCLNRYNENQISSWSGGFDDGSTFRLQDPKIYVTSYAATFNGYDDSQAPVGAIGTNGYMSNATNKTAFEEAYAAATAPTATTEQVKALAEINKQIAAQAGETVQAGKYYRLYNASDARKWLTVKSDNNSILNCSADAEKGIGSVVTFETISSEAGQYRMKFEGKTLGKYKQDDVAIQLVDDNSGEKGSYTVNHVGTKFTFYDRASNNVHSYLHCNKNNLVGWIANSDPSIWYVVPATDIEVALNNAGDNSYATAYLPFGVSAVSGADAYVGTLNAEKTALNMTQTTSVPAGKGFVLVGAADAKATLTIGNVTETVNSDLTGTNTAITLTDENRTNYLVFGRKKDVTTNELGFFKTTAAKIPANKAFLNASALAQEAIAMNFGGNTTGVNTVVLGENGVNAPVFDLSGRRVVAPVKGGVYIQNGKKFIK